MRISELLNNRVYRLRWKMRTVHGKEYVSSWTPQTLYPSITKTLEHIGPDLYEVLIEGENLYNNRTREMLRFDAASFHGLSYKVFHNMNRGLSFVAGIELEDIQGNKFFVAHDGNTYTGG